MDWDAAEIIGVAGKLVRRKSWPATASDFDWLLYEKGLWFRQQYVLVNKKLSAVGQKSIVTASRFTKAEFEATNWVTEEDYTSPTPAPTPVPGELLSVKITFYVANKITDYPATTNRYALYVIPLAGGSPYSIGFLTRVSTGRLTTNGQQADFSGTGLEYKLGFKGTRSLFAGDKIEVVGINTLSSIAWDVETEADGRASNTYAGGGAPWSGVTPQLAYLPQGRSAGQFPIKP